MSYSALVDTPIEVNLLLACNDTGWSVDGDKATHESCNAGLITNRSFPVKAGQTYQVSYAVISISGGYVQLQTPGANGAMQTTANLYVETVSPAADGFVTFYSNANCVLQSFNIRNSSDTSGNTIAWSFITKKWSDRRTFYPDFGWSLFANVYTAFNGALYNHLNGSESTNNFYGVQYTSSVKFVSAKAPNVVKSYMSISLQANQLMVTTAGGITNSLGQISELETYDFVKSFLAGGGSTVQVTSVEGVYSASFLKDINSIGGIINGDSLRGNYIIIELTTLPGAAPLKLFSVQVNGFQSKIGAR